MELCTGVFVAGSVTRDTKIRDLFLENVTRLLEQIKSTGQEMLLIARVGISPEVWFEIILIAIIDQHLSGLQILKPYALSPRK